jgi:peptide/nickel transport system substrate-binding protein
MAMDDRRQVFETLLAGARAGRFTRRQVLARAAAAGLSFAALEVLLTACGGSEPTATVAPVSSSAPASSAPASAAPAGGASAAPSAAPSAAASTAASAAPSAAASAAGAAGAPKRGGTLKVGLQADPTSLDPHKQSLTALFHVTEHIYNTLVQVDEKLTPVPELAERWEISPDGKTYTFTLRQGVKWHNGRAFVAADVKYSYERILDKATASPNASLLAPVDKIETPNDRTVVITIKAPDASFLTNLSSAASVIVPEEEVEKNGDLTKVAVGTGPFKFKEYVPNTRVVLERNPDYWEAGKPYVDRMEMTPISDDTQRTTAVRTGTVDFIEYAPAKDIETLKRDTSLTIAGDQNTNIRFLAINTKRKPFDNVKVREAISLAIDRDAILGPAVFGAGTATKVLFPPGYWATLDEPPGKPDPARARALLAEAGVASGTKLTILSWQAYGFLSNAALVVQEQLKQIGLNAEVDLQENAAFLKNYTEGNFDLSVTGTSAYVDPNDIFFRNFATGQRFAIGYSNPEVDKLIAAGVATTNREERKKIYADLQRLLLADLPWVNLYIANQYEAMKTYVKGYTHIPTGTNIALRNTWLDR